MKLTIKTTMLQEMLGRAVKGAGNNKLIPLTGMVCINKVGNKLILTTTNATEYLYVIENNVTGDDFYVTVVADSLNKLISKLTCEDTTLALNNNSLEIIGNGKYSMEIPLDENGNIIKFLDPFRQIHPQDNEEIEFTDKISSSVIRTILDTVKSSLAVTLEMPVLVNYYVGDSVVATDSVKMASYNKKLFKEECLISSELMNILSLITEEDINVKVTKDYILFVTDSTIVYSPAQTDLEEYPIDAVEKVIQEKFKNSCTVNRSKFIALLDRISLFVSTYDEGIISLSFGKKALEVVNRKESSTETLDYIEVSKKATEYSCLIDINALINQVKSCVSENIQIQYGNEVSIKIIDGDVTKVIALGEDE